MVLTWKCDPYRLAFTLLAGSMHTLEEKVISNLIQL